MTHLWLEILPVRSYVLWMLACETGACYISTWLHFYHTKMVSCDVSELLIISLRCRASKSSHKKRLVCKGYGPCRDWDLLHSLYVITYNIYVCTCTYTYTYVDYVYTICIYIYTCSYICNMYVRISKTESLVGDQLTILQEFRVMDREQVGGIKIQLRSTKLVGGWVVLSRWT